jgi:S1-C subfamily serine protease
MLGGDLIVKFDGQDITNGPDLAGAMNAKRAGDTVTVTVFRGRKEMDFKVTLGDAKSQAQGPQI